MRERSFTRKGRAVAALSTMVVKLGTAMLMRDGKIRKDILEDFARQVECLIRHQSTTFVILVTSGAIQMGREVFGELEDKQSLAGIGQPHLMCAWIEAFRKYGRTPAQTLVTHANWENEGERESVRTRLEAYRKWGVVPIVNENDVVSAREIRLMERGISENDILAAYVARLVNADGILFLTEGGGVRIYDRSQRGRVIRRLSLEDLDKVNVRHGNSSGRGGMEKKFDAIRFSAENNPAMRIVVAGRQKDAIARFAKGDPVGTRIITGGK